MNTKDCITHTQEVSSSQLDRVMKPQQFERIVEAILAGKYSWACVLILRFAGYNPLHYIPYRTYNRLVKNHSSRMSLNQLPQSDRHQQQKSCVIQSSSTTSKSSSSLIGDLNYLENVSSQEQDVRGGNMSTKIIETLYSHIDFEFYTDESLIF